MFRGIFVFTTDFNIRKAAKLLRCGEISNAHVIAYYLTSDRSTINDIKSQLCRRLLTSIEDVF